MQQDTRAPETWRVVLAGGRIRNVMCATNESGRAWLPEDPRTYVVSDDGPREAAVMLAAHMRWAVAEILAPGELTREEAVVSAVKAEREACTQVARVKGQELGGRYASACNAVAGGIRARGT